MQSVANTNKDILLLKQLFDDTCSDSIIGSEWSLHQIAPYIGKIKSSIAKYLIENFTTPNDVVYDPFCGAGTIPLEAWTLNRKVIANDLNKYAVILTKAKLAPPKSLDEINEKIELSSVKVELLKKKIDTIQIPDWVKSFFHEETLRETVAWFKILEEKKDWFLLACLLGILHHQRPGFLSYPSSHTVPYLRIKKFPPDQFPQLYEYRSVKERLKKKAERAFKKKPEYNTEIKRICFNDDASTLIPVEKIDAIITSPPYMRQLDYARDNRLRLWFLGVEEIKELDSKISPKESDFITMITNCLINWSTCLKNNGKCILFLGDNYLKKYKTSLPELVEKIAVQDLKTYKLIFKHHSLIPDNRRVRRKHSGNRVETLLVFQKI